MESNLGVQCSYYVLHDKQELDELTVASAFINHKTIHSRIICGNIKPFIS